MKVKDIMKTEVVTISKDATCKKAAALFIDKKISGAPVIDDNGKLVGILSEKDIFRSMFPTYEEFYGNPAEFLDFEELEKNAKGAFEEKKVKDLMADRVIVANPDTPVLKIGSQMVASGIHRIPVVEGEKLVGIVSRRDIYRAIMRKYLGMWHD